MIEFKFYETKTFENSYKRIGIPRIPLGLAFAGLNHTHFNYIILEFLAKFTLFQKTAAHAVGCIINKINEK